MALNDLTDRRAVIKAMEEFDRLGANEFYAKYGFGKAVKFLILHKGKYYDSKAIVAVAHRYQHGKPLKNTFSGGMKTVIPVLERLNFKVVSKSIDRADSPMPEEVPGDLWEGARKQVSVNAYERDAKARKRCIKVHGSTCAICEFDFAARYGKDFEGFIHVHHRVPLAKIGKKYKVDPVKDLVPVCPNCHAVLHHGGVHRTVDDVRKLLRRSAGRA